MTLLQEYTNTFDSSLGANLTGTGGKFGYDSGAMYVTQDNSYPSAYTVKTDYDARGSYVYAKVGVGLASGTTGGYSAVFGVTSPDNVTQTQIVTSNGVMRLEAKSSTPLTAQTLGNYDATSRAWQRLKFSADASQVTVGFSPDGVSWSDFGTFATANPSAHSAVRMKFAAGTSSTTASRMTIDNINTPGGGTVTPPTDTSLLTNASPAATALARRVKWGAYAVEPGDPGQIDNHLLLETKLGVRLPFFSTFHNWSGGFPSDFSKKIMAQDSVNPSDWILCWEPYGVKFADIISGTKDSYIRGWAAAAKAHPGRLVIRFAHEANGNWYDWAYASGKGYVTSPQQYIDGWRHVVQVFRDAGATNVDFCYNVNVDNVGGTTMEQLYPGTDYVDVISSDGYSRTPFNASGEQPQLTFTQTVQNAYTRLTALHPTAEYHVHETGCTTAPQGTHGKSNFYRSMYQTTNFPRLTHIAHFSCVASGYDWRLDTDADSLAVNKFYPRYGITAAGTPGVVTDDPTPAPSGSTFVLGGVNAQPVDVPAPFVLGGVNAQPVTQPPTTEPVLSPAQNLTVVALDGSARLSWRKPDDATPVEYLIETVLASAVVKAETLDVSKLTSPYGYTVSSLANGARYTLRVSARYGTAYSLPVTITVTPKATPEAPGAVSALTPVVYRAGAGATWTGPANSGTARLLGYRVTLSSATSDARTWTVTAERIAVAGLTNGVAYSIGVEAYSADGYGPAQTTFVTPLASGPAVDRPVNPDDVPIVVTPPTPPKPIVKRKLYREAFPAQRLFVPRNFGKSPTDVPEGE